MACAWSCENPKVAISPSRASRRHLARANQLDDLVEVIEGEPEAFEDVRARLGLLQLELDPPPHDLAAELDELLDELEQAQDLRPAARDGEHDDAEGRLQLRVLVEVVQDDLGHLAALQLDHDAHAIAIRLVAQVRDAFDRLLAHQLRDVLDQALLVDLVRNLGHDDRLLVALLRRLDLGARPDGDRAAALAVRLHDPRAADDDAAGGEVGPGDDPKQVPQALLAGGDLRSPSAGAPLGQPSRLLLLLDDVDDPGDDLAQVVRRDVGRHPDGDARGAVHQQVGNRRRKDGRLFGGLVVVRDEVHRVLLEVGHQVFGEALQPRFGVAHRRRRIAVHRAEVPLAVHQGYRMLNSCERRTSVS